MIERILHDEHYTIVDCLCDIDLKQLPLRLGLAREELASLHAGTEGWAAGLRLLAGSLDQIPTSAGRAAFVAHLARSNSYVFEFLADEVLERQSAEVRSFLLETSILAELGPSLCRAVTGRSDAGAVLEGIYRRNLFVVAVDETGAVYRYHHLFAEFLRRRLAEQMPDRVVELHRRAAEAEIVPGRAISHFLAARLWDRAVEMVEQVGEQSLRDGMFHTLRGWIEALPGSIRDALPRLLYILGVCALQRGALDEASSLLEPALGGFEAAGDEAGQGLCILQLMDIAVGQFDFERQAALTRQALAHPLPPHGRVQLLMALAWQSEYQHGDWSQVEASVDEAMRITLESGDVRALNVLASVLRLDFTLLPDGPERLERYCGQVLARFGEGTGFIQAGAHSLLGCIQLLRGRLDEAVQEAERVRAISDRLGGSVWLDTETEYVLSYTSVARGDCASAESRWEAQLRRAEETPALAHHVVPFLHFMGRAQWLQGAFDRATQTHERMCNVVNAPEPPEVALSRALMRALLEIADGRHADAERTLRPMIAIEQQHRQCILCGSARLLLAYVYLQSNRPRDALSELAPVLEEHERRGSPGWILKEGALIVVPLLQLAVERGIHVPFALRLLDLFGASVERRRAYVADTGETLTTRELEVLRLVADGASNRAIAEQLVINESTAKNHVTNILRKLNVQSRTHAVARAQALRIV